LACFAGVMLRLAIQSTQKLPFLLSPHEPHSN
jgi:hypothetical protein